MKNRFNNNNININRVKSPVVIQVSQQNNHYQRNFDRNLVTAQIQLQKHKSTDHKPKIIQRANHQQPKHNQLRQQKDSQPNTSNLSNPLIVNRAKEDDDNTTQQSSSQYINYGVGDYQLDSYDMLNRKKNVKFQEKIIDFQRKQKVLRSNDRSSHRNSSILKNTVRVLDRSLANSSQKSISIQNSFTAVKKTRTLIPQLAHNITIKNKYQALIQSLQQKSKGRGQNKQKYIDNRFPPVQCSIFNTSIHKKNTMNRGKEEIFWMRITEIFQSRTIKVFSNNKKSDNIVINGCKNFVQQYLLDSFNAISQNTSLLANIFEVQQINRFGVYLVKIYQQNSWKYLIIDDLIPCVKKRNKLRKQDKYEPVFIDVLAPEESVLYIWPFLLEKAYSNYYGCYQNLCFGNIIDFISQLTGSSYNKISLNNIKKQHQMIQKNLSIISKEITNENNILIAFNQQKQAFYHLSLPQTIIQSQGSILQYKDPLKNYENIKIKLQILPNQFSCIYLYKYNQYQNSITCPIYPPKNIKEKPKNIKGKQDQKNKYIQIPPNDTISIRTFTLLKNAQISLNIKQKEMRFYYQCGLTEYLWVRAILAQKQYDGGLRWINGKYSNSKQIIFDQYLQPGDYYLIVMTEWRQKHNKQLIITLYSNCQYLKFDRKNYQKQQRTIELCCMDLAQRFGKLSQINKSICAYKYLCQQAAFIIQNINNERTKGDVTIMRSFNGLRSKVEILPINPEFQKDIPEDYGSIEKQNKTVIGFSTEIDIKKGQSFTVVLRMRGGIDRKFFKIFNFG